MIKAKLIALTQPVVSFPASSPEGILAHCARVSSNRDYDKRGEDYEKLFKYCIKNKHWSIFEMANAVVEVQAPRDISRQLLRHDFKFQEFSQRYSDDIEFTGRDIRRQDVTNRQNSIEDEELPHGYFYDSCKSLKAYVKEFYDTLIREGVAKECARVILPEGLTMSTLYVNGTVRNWLHYLDVRDDPGVTQWEHVLLARSIRKELVPAFPTLFKEHNDKDD